MTTLNEPTCRMCGHRALDLVEEPIADWPYATYGKFVGPLCGLCAAGMRDAYKPEKPTNAERATRAECAVLGHAGDLEADLKTAITDLLTDIMHLCAREQFKRDNLIAMAALHYLQEGK